MNIKELTSEELDKLYDKLFSKYKVKTKYGDIWVDTYIIPLTGIKFTEEENAVLIEMNFRTTDLIS